MAEFIIELVLSLQTYIKKIIESHFECCIAQIFWRKLGDYLLKFVWRKFTNHMLDSALLKSFEDKYNLVNGVLFLH